jgi:cbb3-type cytochrome oxidase maturation protein
MNGLAFLIPVALLLGLGGLAAFLWSLGAGQYDDMDGAALRILIDEEGAGAAMTPGIGAEPRP